uniref:Uncharacterized protein n=1 Tax=Tetranychus urticae TaxID=32264 RepID=T1KHU6_TETUR
MIQFTLGLLNGFIFPLILGSSDKSPVIIYPKNGEGFSTFSNIEKTKLNPNGATVRQWETRAWITTIPLHKIINLKENPLISLTRFQDPTIASSSSEDHHPIPSLPDLDESYKGYPRRYNSSKNQDSVESRESTDGKRKVSKSLPFHLETLNNSCYGEACRGNLFQGIYDTINHEKQLSSQEDYSPLRYHDQTSQSKSPHHHSLDDNSDSYHYDEDDKKATHSKTNIAWSRLYPTEIATSHHKSGGITRTKDREWKEKRNKVKIQSRKPVIDPLPNQDSFESSEETDHGHHSGPKTIPNHSVSLDDGRYSHHHLTKDISFRSSYPPKEYPPDHIDVWHSSEDPDHSEKSTKKTTHGNTKVKSSKRKRTKKTFRYHHDHSNEEMPDEQDPNSGYGKIEKGSAYEPSNLSGHYSSHESIDKEGNHQYKDEQPKSRKRQRCHCLTNYFDQPKHLNYDADRRRAA